MNGYPNTGSVSMCPNCGTPLMAGQAFCPKCGAPMNSTKKNVCAKCGAELQAGQVFCPMCGQKVGAAVDAGANSPRDQHDPDADKAKAAKKKKLVKTIITVLVIVAVLAAAAFAARESFMSVDDLLAQGKYDKAYAKADADKKAEIRIENAAAVLSAVSVDSLKDPDSFKLRDVYYDEDLDDQGAIDGKDMVLEISANNSYGGRVSNYWYYEWSKETGEWSYECSVSDLDYEEIYDFYDDDEKREIAINSVYKGLIRDTINYGSKLSKDSVLRINTMFEAGILQNVKFLPTD